jgi:hypothetical protein
MTGRAKSEGFDEDENRRRAQSKSPKSAPSSTGVGGAALRPANSISSSERFGNNRVREVNREAREDAPNLCVLGGLRGSKNSTRSNICSITPYSSAFPYATVAIAIAVTIYRFFFDPYSVSSQSSQFLENRKLFFRLGAVALRRDHHFAGAYHRVVVPQVCGDLFTANQTRLYVSWK